MAGDAEDLAGQQALCSQMQLAVMEAAPHIQLGQILQPTAYRRTVSGVADGFAKFWNVKKG